MPAKRRTPTITTDDLLFRLTVLSSDEQTYVLERFSAALRAAERRDLIREALASVRSSRPTAPVRQRRI